MVSYRQAILPLVFLAASIGAQARPVPEPIVLKKNQHEEAQFGYKPEYACNVPSFDSKNRPYMRSRALDLHSTGFFHTLRDGKWVKRSFEQAVKDKYPDFERFDRGAGWFYSHAVFDDSDRMYSVVMVRLNGGKRVVVLLYSTDYGKTFQVYELPGAWPNIELRNDCHPLPGPPLISTMRQLKKHPTAKWGAYHSVMLTLPTVTEEGLEIPEPVVATDSCLGMCEHAGGASFATTLDGKTYITWGKMVESDDLPGVPTMVAVFDRANCTVSEPVFVGHAPPVNDSHNAPGICADSKGHIHVVSGAHGDHFYHYVSRSPRDIAGGFDGPATMLDGGFEHPDPDNPTRPARQTYLGMVCDPDDTLHVGFRWWRRGKNDPYFPEKAYGALGYQSRPAGGKWSEGRALVIPPAHGYSNYHHKLAMDRKGRLYYSYTYFNKQPNFIYGKDYSHYAFPAILTSGDGGKTWELAETRHFAEGVGK